MHSPVESANRSVFLFHIKLSADSTGEKKKTPFLIGKHVFKMKCRNTRYWINSYKYFFWFYYESKINLKNLKTTLRYLEIFYTWFYISITVLVSLVPTHGFFPISSKTFELFFFTQFILTNSSRYYGVALIYRYYNNNKVILQNTHLLILT